MDVKLLRCTPEPEQLICQAARGDYSQEWIGERSFEDVMSRIDAAENMPESVLTAATEDGSSEEMARKKYALIERLLKHGHFGPLEHPHLTFTVTGVSRSLMAQITRHRHITFDIQSMRYVDFNDIDVTDIPEFQTAHPAGRNAEIDNVYSDWDDEEITEIRQQMFAEAVTIAEDAYNGLLSAGVAPENARMVLPIGTQINMTFSLNARALLHIADMRAAADAQFEIREMTEELLEVASEELPITMNVYRENLKGRKNRLAP